MLSRTLEEGQFEKEKDRKTFKSAKQLQRIRPKTTTAKVSAEFLLGGSKRKISAAVRSRHFNSVASHNKDEMTIDEIKEEVISKKVSKKPADMGWRNSSLKRGLDGTKSEPRLTPKAKTTPVTKKNVKKIGVTTTTSSLNQTLQLDNQQQLDTT